VLRVEEVFWSDRVCCNVPRTIHTRHSVTFSVDIPINNNNVQLFGDLLKITRAHRDRVTQVILDWVTAIKYIGTHAMRTIRDSL